MPSRIPSVVRCYLAVLGAVLFLEGAVLLVLGALPADRLPDVAAGMAPDPLHNAIHVLWGLAILLLLAFGLKDFGVSVLAVAFGVFYVALGVVGLLVDRPFGLLLGPGENAFHLIVGPAALLLGIWGLRARQVPHPSPSA